MHDPWLKIIILSPTSSNRRINQHNVVTQLTFLMQFLECWGYIDVDDIQILSDCLKLVIKISGLRCLSPTSMWQVTCCQPSYIGGPTLECHIWSKVDTHKSHPL